MSSIGIDEGVVLGTGNVSIGLGPNVATNSGTDDGVNSNDQDLQQMVNELFQGSNQPIFDATILEFEFTPTVDSVTFEYVFASEEYCDYVESNFNDVFGFFISGPGINGNFSNNAANIALVPGTNDYVSINTLNFNTNSAYYVDNVPMGQPQNAPGCTNEPFTPSPTSDFIEYDGFTVPLQAIANVVPCETYTIKLAVADVGDGRFDSAVMLKAGSFQAGGTALLDVESEIGGNIFYEGCSDGGFYVRRGNTNNFNEPFEITLTIDPSSTAEPGVDYEPFDTVIVIPAFQMEVFIELITLASAEYDGEEKTIILKLDNSCSCEIEETIMIIEPVPPLESELEGDTVCIGSSVIFDPSEEVYPGVDYAWSDGQVGPAITVYPLESGHYSVTLSNVCEDLVDSAYVEVIEQPKATLLVDTAICGEDLSTLDLQITFEGLGPYTFSYTINGESYLINDYEDSIYVIPTEHRDTGRYRINFMDGFFQCQGIIEGGGELTFRSFAFEELITDASCGGNADGQIQIFPDSSALPYSYSWSNGEMGALLDSLSVGSYEVTMTDGFGCTIDTSFEISESSGVNYALELLSAPRCGDSSGAVRIQIDSSDYKNVLWNTGDTTLGLSNLSPGVYSVQIETYTECDIVDSIEVPESPDEPQIEFVTIDGLSCDRDTGYIEAEINALSPFDLLWSTGDTSRSISLSQPGSFELLVTDSLGCMVRRTVNLPIDTLSPLLSLPQSRSFSCIDTALTIRVDTGSWASAEENWSTNGGSIKEFGKGFITVTSSGQYFATVIDTINGCISRDTIEVTPSVEPEFELDSLTSLSCNAQTVAISVTSIYDYLKFSLLSSNGDTLAVNSSGDFIVDEAGSYNIVVLDSLTFCSSDTTIQILENFDSVEIDLPDELLITCAAPAVDLQASLSASGDFTYVWKDNNGENIAMGDGEENEQIFHTVNSTGWYTLEVIDSGSGCVSVDSVEVISDENLPNVNLEVEGSINCLTNSVSVNSSGSSIGSEFQYEWLNSNGEVIARDLTTINIDAAGQYTLRITNADNGCSAERDFTIEEDFAPPIFSLLAGEPFTCARDEIQFSVEYPDSVSVNIQWMGDGQVLGENDDFILSSNTLVDSYQLVLNRSDNGCSDSISFSPEWDTLSPVARIGDLPTVPCDDNFAMVDGSSSTPEGSLDFEWTSFDGQTVSTAETMETQQSGDYQLWVENVVNGCVDSVNFSLEQNPINGFSIEVDPIQCTREYAEIEIFNIEGGTPPYRYSINGQISQDSPNFSNLGPGDYTIEVMDQLGCLWTEEVNISPLDDLRLTLTADLELNYLERRTIQLEVNRSPDEIVSIIWSPSRQLSCSDCLNPTITARQSEEYTVVVRDIFGCEAQITLKVEVSIDPNIFIPNVFSPNGDGINDMFYVQGGPTVVGVPELLVFDRWGNLLFEQRNIPANSPSVGWDGRYKGEVLAPAVFVYLVKVEIVTGNVLTFTGDVTIIK
jgi:gliding motility-associated-like protein